ncbi:MAG TPA: hypothetical protein IGS52_01905 [Oscillatoriaceae cyanobacterium M33_DOE_052]|nr:hypothetical protein [Oscillatoriaceae cyanobacterium M33_DOE_052]
MRGASGWYPRGGADGYADKGGSLPQGDDLSAATQPAFLPRFGRWVSLCQGLAKCRFLEPEPARRAAVLAPNRFFCGCGEKNGDGDGTDADFIG